MSRRKLFTVLSLVTVFACLAIVGLVATFSHDDSTGGTEGMYRPTPTQTALMDQTLDLPRCSESTGKWDGNCWYEDQANGKVLNFNRGEWTYVFATGDMIHNVHKK